MWLRILLLIVVATFAILHALPVVGAEQGGDTQQVSAQILVNHETPVANTSLTINVMRIDVRRMKVEPKSTVETKTDAEGRFSVELPVEDKQVVYRLIIRSDDFLINRLHVRGRAKPGWKVPALAATKLSSVVLGPAGQPVQGAEVTFVMPTNLDNIRYTVKTNGRGEFNLTVPHDKEFGVLVDSPAGAFRRMVMPAGVKEIPTIRLDEGATIRGRLVDVDGQPIANCVMVLRDDDSQAVDNELSIRGGDYGVFDIQRRAMTDQDGRFQFGPFRGDFVIFPGILGEHYQKQDFPEAVQPPPVVPVSLALHDPGQREITLQADQGVPITGTVRTPSGQPAKGVEIRAIHLPRRGFVFMTVAQTKTNKNGRYELIVPKQLEKLRLSTFGTVIDGKSYAVWSREAFTEPERWSSGDFRISKFDGTAKQIDWVLEKVNSIPPHVAAARDASDQRQSEPNLHPALRLLESQVAKARNEDNTAARRKELMDLCFKLEQQSRGTRAGLGALHYIMRAAETSIYAEPTEARRKAVEILKVHYTRHEDVDLMINAFDAGNPPPNAESVLRKVAEESPHRHVQAAAMYELAKSLVGGLQWLPLIKARRQQLEKELAAGDQAKDSESDQDQKSLQAELQRLKEFEAKLTEEKIAAIRKEAIDLLEKTANEYADVPRPTRHWLGPVRVRLTDITDPRLQHKTTTAQFAQAKRFQLVDLVLEKPAPSLSGFDLFHNPVALQDFRGKVVLLTVSNEDDVEMLQAIAGLYDQYGPERFTVLSVLPIDPGGGVNVRDIVREGNISWPIIRDTEEGDLARNWCKFYAPEVFVIDSDGVLRAHTSGDDFISIKRTLADLLDSGGMQRENGAE